MKAHTKTANKMPIKSVTQYDKRNGIKTAANAPEASQPGHFYLDVGALAAERDKAREQHDSCVRRLEDVTKQAFRLRKQRDELLAACKLLVKDTRPDYSDARSTGSDKQNAINKAYAAIAKVEENQ